MNTSTAMVERAGTEVATLNDEGRLMQAIIQAASDKDMDVSKMERLYAMHKEAQAHRAMIDYSNAMTRVQNAMPKIRKNKYNAQTKSYYADLANVLSEAAPVYTKEGFSLSFGQAECPTEGCVRVTCRVSHVGGHSEDYFYDNPIDDAGIQGTKNKTPTHGRSSAVSYAQRYLTKMVFNLILEGEDNDGNGQRAPKDNGKIGKWVAVANEVETLEEYATKRKAAIDDFGGIDRVPQPVRAAFTRAKTEVTPKD